MYAKKSETEESYRWPNREVTTVEPGTVVILFDDQSSMKLKTTGPATIPPSRKVKSGHEAKTEFKIEFENGSSATFAWRTRALPLRYGTRTMLSNISGKSFLE